MKISSFFLLLLIPALVAGCNWDLGYSELVDWTDGLFDSGGGGGHDGEEEDEFQGDFLRFDKQINSFDDEDSFAKEPDMARSGNDTVVVWLEDRDGDGDKVFAAVTDKGTTTFNEENRIDSADDIDNISAVKVAASGDNITVVYFNATDLNVMAAASTDGGETFIEAVQVNTDVIVGDISSDELFVCASGTNVYVMWQDPANDPIFFRASDDVGATWHGAGELEIDADAGGTPSSDPDMVCDGDNLYVTWTDTRDGNEDIYFAASTDGGESFDDEIRIDDGPGNTVSTVPAICVEGDKIWIAWEDDRDGQDIFMNYSANAGGTFLGADVQVNKQVTASAPQIACSDGYAFFAFTGDNGDLHIQRTKGPGSIFLTTDNRVEFNAFDHGSYFISAHDELVYVAWADEDGLVYFNYSLKRGATFYSSEKRACETGAEVQPDSLKMITTATYVHLVWTDEQEADNSDIFYQKGK
ncbi:sialidase family protein [Planctomycetota bacterium]